MGPSCHHSDRTARASEMVAPGRHGCHGSWRRGWDLNPRGGIPLHAFQACAIGRTRRPLQDRGRRLSPTDTAPHRVYPHIPTSSNRQARSVLTDEELMRLAIAEAERARSLGEVPIGCAIAVDGEVVALAHNLRESSCDPTAHAEVLALRSAAKNLGSWRLEGATVVSTLEPCPMCAGALLSARVARLVFGAPDPKAGAVSSLYNLVQDPRLNHEIAVTAGVLQNECGELLTSFFSALRSDPSSAND